MTPLTEVSDLLSVMEYAAGHYEEFGSHGSIVLCGHSLGGLVSLLVASALSGGRVHGLEYAGDIGKLSSALAGLFLLAPAVNVEADSKAGRVGTVTFDPENIPEIVEVWGSSLSKKYFVTARELDTFKTISRLSWACLRAAGRKGPPRGDESGGQDKCSPASGRTAYNTTWRPFVFKGNQAESRGYRPGIPVALIV